MGQLSSLHYQQQNEARWFSHTHPNVMSSIFLLVGDSPGSPWALTVREQLNSLGNLETVSASQALEQISSRSYRMVLVDAGAIEDMGSFISAVREIAPSMPIVVATASPTWQSAKEVFLTGADDYIRKSLDPDALNAILREILSRSR
jgi:DNA-binding response OmpR family regulator